MKNNTFAQMANTNTQMRGGQCYCSLSRKSYAFIMMILFSIVAIQAQTLVNRTWENLTGLPDTIDWKASLTDVDGNVVIAGNTLTAPGETALLITKYDREGIELWTISYEYNGNTHNYATAITGDANGNLFVAGATSGTNLLFDFLTLSVDVNGNIVWAKTYNGLSNLYDVPTAIALDNSGNVVVVGGSYGLTTQSDYLTVKYDANGSLQWAVSYDYIGLHDAPIEVKIDPNDNIIVTGASASATNNYDYTTIGYDTWGTQISIDRQNIVGAGLDSPLAMIRDNAGNIYITGKVQNGTNIDIRTLKLNASFALQWAVSYDLAGLEDVGNDLTIDNLGNIYVVGYATNADGGREYVTIKYDPMGTQVWEQRMQAIDSTQKAEAAKIYADNTGKIYVAGTMEIGTEKMIVSVCYDNTGRKMWLQNYSETMGSNDKVVGINKDIYGSVYLISTVDNGSGTQYATVRYDGFETPKEVVYDVDSLPLYMDNQLIINFKPDSNSLKLAPFYDRRKIWGTLDEFVQTDAIAAIADKLGIINLGKAKVEKIFKKFTPNDSINVSRNGRSYLIPKFWASLLVYIPISAATLTEEREMSDSLRRLREYIMYAEPNWIFHNTGTAETDECTANANDDDYDANQKSLHFNSNEINVNTLGLQYNVTSDANINIEGAWNKEIGKKVIKVGVIDSGIRWKHKDLGSQFGEVVVGGWDFENNIPASQSVIGLAGLGFLENTHGTQVAGIIAAIRNNNDNNSLTKNDGVAGIAGGSAALSNTGVSLLDYRIDGSFPTSAQIVAAIVEASTSSLGNCNILNMSNGSLNYDYNLKQAIDYAYRAEVTVIASRGNVDGTSNKSPLSNPTDNFFPATFPDDEVISVGGSGFNGQIKISDPNNPAIPDPSWQSAHSQDMDVMAPSEKGMVWSTEFHSASILGIPYLVEDCVPFGQTSASAPHVAGLAALMQSDYLSNFILSPDDNEHLIQKYADDKGAITGYEPESGWGLINATNTLNGLAFPDYKIEHYDNSSPSFIASSSLYAANQVINIIDDCQTFLSTGIAPGQYYVDIYKTTGNFTYSPPLGMILDDYWSRNSEAGGIALPPFASGEYTFDCKTFAPHADISANGNSATMTSYLLYLKDFTNGTPSPITWFPGGVQFGMSLYWKQGANAVSQVKLPLDFQLYPNPTDKVLNVVIGQDLNQDTRIEVLDIQGKILQTILTTSTKTEIPTNVLPQGFYMIRLTNTVGTSTKIFIVQ